MATRLARTVAHAARPTLMRARAPLGLRAMGASHAHEQASSDMPWIIGSGTITIAGLIYLLAPQKKKHDTHGSHSAHDSQAHEPHPTPAAAKAGDGTKPPASDSVQESAEASSPGDAEAAEESEPTPEPEADASSSTDESKSDDKSASSSETPESKDKPDTAQDSGDHVTNLGNAEENAQDQKAPSESKEEGKEEI